jgi:hypothetical protein
VSANKDFDPIDRPAHYNFSDLQPIDAAITWGLDYLRGNALKYLVRAGRKTPDPREDIKKAIFYLKRFVEEYDKWLTTNGKTSSGVEKSSVVMRDPMFDASEASQPQPKSPPPVKDCNCDSCMRRRK